MAGTDAEELQSTDLVLRVDALDRPVASASAGDGAAIDVLRLVAHNYREFDIEIWGRALNRVEDFIDDSLRAPIVAAVADEEYGGQAHAAMICGRLGYAEAAPAVALLLQHAKGFDRSVACEALGNLALPEYASVLGNDSTTSTSGLGRPQPMHLRRSARTKRSSCFGQRCCPSRSIGRTTWPTPSPSSMIEHSTGSLDWSLTQIRTCGTGRPGRWAQLAILVPWRSFRP